jgi:hypothetical protein
VDVHSFLRTRDKNLYSMTKIYKPCSSNQFMVLYNKELFVYLEEAPKLLKVVLSTYYQRRLPLKTVVNVVD